MATAVTMPALGESVTEGTVTRWLKNIGDTVEADEPLLEVSTDKVDTEIPSPASGVLTSIAVNVDETVTVGTQLALIGEEGEQVASSPIPQVQPAPSPEPASPSPTEKPVVPQAGHTAVLMPALGESVAEGTVTRWLKNVGDTVEADEPLLEVSTDKVDTEIPSPASGVLTSIAVNVDETVTVGTQLALIGEEAAAAPPPQAHPELKPQPDPERQPDPEPQSEAQAAAPHPVPQAEPTPRASSSPPSASTSSTNGDSTPSVYLTPLVRKLAAQEGVDVQSLRGTGVGGRIRKQDVLDAAQAAQASSSSPAAAGSPAPSPATPVQPSPLRGTRVPMSRLRKVIAARMVESLQTSAQLTTVVEVDLTRVAALRARAKQTFQAREGVNLSFLPFLAKTAIETLKAHASVNASIEGEQIIYHDTENLAIAVDTDRGLLVPVIKNAGQLTIADLARRIADLAERTRTNKVTPDELSGGTFTLTNTGSRGALFDTPIINQPQVAILGTGALVKRPVVVSSSDGDQIAIRSMMYLALSYDHRLVDGADAARFLTAMKTRLEEGAFESELGLTTL